MENLLQSRDQTFKSTADNIGIAQKKQKEIYDRKHLPQDFLIGAEVLVENSANR